MFKGRPLQSLLEKDVTWELNQGGATSETPLEAVAENYKSKLG
jgi:hypothetical protein